jgi:hypothetical protein
MPLKTQILQFQGFAVANVCKYLISLRIRNQQAVGSIPSAGSSKIKGFSSRLNPLMLQKADYTTRILLFLLIGKGGKIWAGNATGLRQD